MQGGVECLRSEERRIETGARVREWAVFLSTIEDAVTAAENELVRNLIRHSNARREIVAVRSDESARAVALKSEFGGKRGRQLRVLAARSNQRKRVEIKCCFVVVRLFNGSEEFVAQAEVQGESRSYFEIVQTIDRINLPVVDDVVGAW